mgnify:CR=1 FL=1|jgi:hypothetical protein
MKSQLFSIRSLAKEAWHLFKDHALMLVGVTVFVLGFSGFFLQVQEVANEKFGIFLRIVVFIFTLVAQMVLLMGLTNIAVRGVRGKSYGFRDLFRPGEVFGHYVLAALTYAGILLLGFWFSAKLIMMGAWNNELYRNSALIFLYFLWYFTVGIRYMFYSYAIVDRKISWIKALRLSANLTSNGKSKIIFALLFIVAINILGIVPLYLGLLVTIPFSLLFTARLYATLLLAYENRTALHRVDPATSVHDSKK